MASDTEILDALEAFVAKTGGLRLHTGDYELKCPGIRTGGEWGTVRDRLAQVLLGEVCPATKRRKRT